VEDPFGHRISYLRISVTDRCNERCRYCMPEEFQQWLPRTGILSYEEILRVAAVAASLGVSKVRVTGGEPLTRRGVLGFIRSLCAIPGIREVGISTNGTLLAAPDPETGGSSRTTAEILAESGVRSVNVSLDTLDREKYAAICGRDFLPRAIEGIEAASAAGIPRVKLNAVLMKDRSEEDLPALLDFAAQRGLILRFIELMPVSTRDVLTDANFLPVAAARRIIEQRHGKLLPAADKPGNGPAAYYQLPGSGQLIGFIGALTNLHFCDSCNKLRLTADGKLRPCLGSYLEFDLLRELRAGATDDDLRRFFQHVVDRKPKEHDFRANYQPNRSMTAIGG
jgi:cyclic pyranopterin phosphate synthase